MNALAVLLGVVLSAASFRALNLPPDSEIHIVPSGGQALTCAPDQRACVAEVGPRRFVIAVRPARTRDELQLALRHELCHIRHDRAVINDWERLDKKERGARERRAKRCAKESAR